MRTSLGSVVCTPAQEGPLCALMKTRKWADAEALILGEVAASNQGSKELVSRLVLEKDKEDRLPLHLACDLGAPTELVRLLLDHNDGAREEVEGEVFEAVVSSSQSSRMEEKERRLQSMIVDTTFKRDCMGRIPLHCAAAAGASADVITMLMDYPYPDKSCAIPEDPSVGTLSCDACRGLPMFDGGMVAQNKDPMLLRETFYGKTPLELAQMKGHDATIKALGGKCHNLQPRHTQPHWPLTAFVPVQVPATVSFSWRCWQGPEAIIPQQKQLRRPLL